MAHGLRFTVYGLQFTFYGLRFTFYGLRFTAYGLQLTTTYSLWLIADLKYDETTYHERGMIINVIGATHTIPSIRVVLFTFMNFRCKKGRLRARYLVRKKD